jgi:hypothetical protein
MLQLNFPGVELRAELTQALAPESCALLARALERPLSCTARHAIWTGPEISMPLPTCQQTEPLAQHPAEALSVFPQPGDLLLTALPPHAWPGQAGALIDLGLFYGPQGRCFFPLGWLAGTLVARLLPEDLAAAAELGSDLLRRGEQLAELRWFP